MSERFIKYIPSQTAEWLRENHTYAWSLLSLIAERACRTKDHFTGLKIGEAYIGDYKKAGIKTRGQYRHALSILIEIGAIEVIETCRTRKLKNSLNNHQNIGEKDEITTTKLSKTNQQPPNDHRTTTENERITTTKGTLVRLLDSSFWDINSDDNNHHKENFKNQDATKLQPRTKNEENVSFVYLKENEKRKEPVRSIRSSDRIVSFPSLQKEEKVKEILEICVAYNLDVGDKSLDRWLLKFGQEMIVQLLSSLIDKKESVRNHEAWMEKSLQLTLNVQKNKQFIELFISQHNITYIILTKNYCRDSETGNDYQYSLPHEQFVEIITRKHETKQGVSLYAS